MRKPPNTPYESREFEQLKRRNFKPYSAGHQAMYLEPIAELAGRRLHIFEAGFGIGFGLDKMVEAGIVESYYGCEPNPDSFDYVQQRYAKDPRVKLIRAEFGVAFCIEVIEHVPMEEHTMFLARLGQLTSRLYFSTPDKDKSREGVRTKAEWLGILAAAGWRDVTVNQSHWTYLYTCR
jgi:SAM-dependent methyltransferase